MREVTADASWRVIELLSDVHLAPGAPGTFDAWAARLRDSDADALFILGDLFEAWVGDDTRHAAFESRCLAVLADTAARRAMFFMAGNRDFLLGKAMLNDAGLRGLDDPSVLVAFGRRWLLAHGDALCLADTDYQRFRLEVRSAQWQRDFLARPLVERRELARGMRDASTARQRALSPTDYADIDTPAALALLQQARATTLIHGHTHRPGSSDLGEGCTRHVLSDWHCEAGAPPRGDVLRLSADGVQRLQAHART